MDRTRFTRLSAGIAGAILAISSVGTVAAQDGGYTIGVSNTVQGNGWREEITFEVNPAPISQSGSFSKYWLSQ